MLFPSRIIFNDWMSALEILARLSSFILLPRFVLFKLDSEETGRQLNLDFSLLRKLVAPESETLSSVYRLVLRGTGC